MPSGKSNVFPIYCIWLHLAWWKHQILRLKRYLCVIIDWPKPLLICVCLQQFLSSWYSKESNESECRLITPSLLRLHFLVILIELLKQLHEFKAVIFLPISIQKTPLYFVLLKYFIYLFVMHKIIVELFGWEDLLDSSKMLLQK